MINKAGYLLSSLILVLACSLLLSLVGCGSPMTEEQRAAMKKITDMGGKVTYRHHGFDVDLRNTYITDAELAEVKKISKVNQVYLSGTRVTDAGIRELKKDRPDVIVNK